MEDKGLISSTLEDAPAEAGGLPRRIYEPTALGKRMLAAFTSGAKVLTPEFSR
jgi:DNA-binding PadR family transcriptional regulator